jgi:hypothetical protein
MPTLTLRGSSVRKAFAAFCAATRRLGLTSVARMLPETSMARMMVSWVIGRLTTANGRDAANSMAVMASRNNTGGMWRRMLWLVPRASLTMDRLAYRKASFFLRRSNHRYSSTSRGTASSSHRNCGHRKVMGDVTRVSP